MNEYQDRFMARIDTRGEEAYHDHQGKMGHVIAERLFDKLGKWSKAKE